jgi:hypothetical protein
MSGLIKFKFGFENSLKFGFEKFEKEKEKENHFLRFSARSSQKARQRPTSAGPLRAQPAFPRSPLQSWAEPSRGCWPNSTRARFPFPA